MGYGHSSPLRRDLLKSAVAFLFCGSLLIGLAFAALLPPFEGFDETAHYSYIRQIAQGAGWPRLNDPISADVTDYLDVAPGPAALNSKFTYDSFFASSRETIAAGERAVHSPRPAARDWRAGRGGNWEAQHPPLYYTLLAPVLRLSDGLGLHSQLFLLRGLSYFIAWLGLCVACLASLRASSSDHLTKAALVLTPALWPAIFPMWFPEMGRLGNDALCVLIIAWAWIVAQQIDRKSGGMRTHFSLGLATGLGLLTKATFLPFAFAVTVFLVARAGSARIDPLVFRARLQSLAIFLITILLLAGSWYARNLIEFGTILGSNDEVFLQQKGGMLVGLIKNGSILGMVGGFVRTAATFLWSGTWSFALPPVASKLPLGALLAVLAVGYLWQIRARTLGEQWIALLTLGAFVAGLVHRMLIFIASSAIFTVPAWYLHSIAPVMAPLVGRGLASALRWPIRGIVVALLIYPVVFLPFATFVQVLYFAGCGNRIHSYFDFASATFCPFETSTIYANLAILGRPMVAQYLFVVGWIAMCAGLIMALRHLHDLASTAAGRGRVA